MKEERNSLRVGETDRRRERVSRRTESKKSEETSTRARCRGKESVGKRVIRRKKRSNVLVKQDQLEKRRRREERMKSVGGLAGGKRDKQ